MDVRGFQIPQAGAEESAGSGPSFLSGNEHALSCEVAPCRPPAMAARTVRDAGDVRVGQGLRACSIPTGNSLKINLDFRIYFAIIRSALAVLPRTSNQNATVKAVAFCHFGVATLCRCSQPRVTLGGLGWKGVYIGGRGRVGQNCQNCQDCQTSPGLKTKAYLGNNADFHGSEYSGFRGSLVVILNEFAGNRGRRSFDLPFGQGSGSLRISPAGSRHA